MAGWNHYSPISIRRKGDPETPGDRASKRLTSTGGNVATSFLRVKGRRAFDDKTLAKFVPMFAIGSFLSAVVVVLAAVGAKEATPLTLTVHTTLSALFFGGIFLVIRAPFAAAFGLAIVQLTALWTLAFPSFDDPGPLVIGCMLFNVVLWWNMKDALRLRILRREVVVGTPRETKRRRRLRLVSIPDAWRLAMWTGLFASSVLLLLQTIGAYLLWTPDYY